MKLGPILAYTRLPLMCLVGGLAMMFSSLAPAGQQAVYLRAGAAALVVAFSLLPLIMVQEYLSIHRVRMSGDPAGE
jgi:hypothetical protein